jgi:hypothetical protein
MSSLSDLRTALQAIFAGINPRAVHQSVRGESAYPRLVWDLASAGNDEHTEMFVLEVDGWDDALDTTRLEQQMEALDAGLHRRVLSLPGAIAAIYREQRQSVPQEDDRLRRRHYTYQVRLIN